MDQRVEKILKFWFGDVGKDVVLDENSAPVRRWFFPDEKTGKDVSQLFEGDLLRARKRKYDDWADDLNGRLALILLFDQVSRYAFRNNEKAFENDLRALEYCFLSIKDGSDQKMDILQRAFLYMPLVNSEDIKIQKMAVKHFGELVFEAKEANDKNTAFYERLLAYAQKHYDIIKEFNRFPQRNKALKRRSTPEEEEFLSGFSLSF